ncbi:hypothetical protein, partial [Streptococcus agalactiae]|uniref:hypothetical protein n=1 Tax=Streptococcus agalactiae TaxID=1311 RepID=UPI001C5EEB7E
ALLEPFGLKAALLTSSVKGKRRRELLEQLKQGDCRLSGCPDGSDRNPCGAAFPVVDALLEPFGLKAALLTSSVKGKRRRELLEQLKQG